MDRRILFSLPVVCGVLYPLLLLIIYLEGSLPGMDVFRVPLGLLALGVIPGYALLVLLNLDDRPLGRVGLYSLTASQVLMVSGAIVLNQLGWLGIDRPLTPLSIVTTTGLLTAVFLLIHYYRQKEIHQFTAPEIPSTRVLLGTGLLTMVVLAAGVLTRTGPTWLLSVVLCVIAVLPMVLLWADNDRLTGYGIWAIAAAVLLQMTLVSNHIWGFDIHFEFHAAREILLGSHWNPTMESASNSLVMVTLLGANYATVTGLDLVWVYKLLVPIMVALLPVGIWYIVRATTGDRRIATLAPFALVFYYGFFKDMPDKQLLGGLYATLLLVVLLDDGLSRRDRILLGLVMGFGLVGSHYGVSLLFGAFLGATLLARMILDQTKLLEEQPIATRVSRPWIVVSLITLWIGWYGITAGGVNLERVVGAGLVLLESLPLPASDRSGADYATTGFGSPVWVVYKLLYFVLVGLIGVGLLRSLLDSWFDRQTVATEYVLLSCGVFGFLGASVVFTFGMGFDRTLQIALFVLGPFAVIGARTAIELISEIAHRVRPQLDNRWGPESGDQLFAVVLAILFVFSSGVAFTATGAPVPPYNLNLNENAGWPAYTDAEVSATRWLEDHTDPSDTVAVINEWEHIKSRDGLLVSEVVPVHEIEPIWLERERLTTDAYVYVSHKPMRTLESDSDYIDPTNTTIHENQLANASVVYENERVTIYHIQS